MSIENHQILGKPPKAGVVSNQNFGGVGSFVSLATKESVDLGSWLPYCVPEPVNRAKQLGYNDGPYFAGAVSCDLDGQAFAFNPASPNVQSFAAHHAAGGNSIGIWFIGGGINNVQGYIWQSFHTTGVNDNDVPTYSPAVVTLAGKAIVPIPIVPVNPLTPPLINQAPIGGTESGEFFQRKVRELPPGTKAS